MAAFNIKRGLDIKLAGAAEKLIEAAPLAPYVALKPTDFLGIKPKLLVAEGDSVKIGTPLLYLKHQPDIVMVSPAGGKVSQIVRGDRRAIQEIVIERSADEDKVVHGTVDRRKLKKMSRETLIRGLLEGGMWPFIRQRPLGIIANPGETPQSIFINGMDTAPLAADPNVLVEGQKESFQLGIDAMKKLTDGKVYLTLKTGANPSSAFSQVEGVEMHYFKGPHPSGLVGTHIRKIEPLRQGRAIWYLNAGDVVALGEFLKKGVFPVYRIVAMTGSGIIKRKYLKTRIGIQMTALLSDRLGKGQYRIISGNVLTGKEVDSEGFLGFYDTSVTVIPEGTKRDLFGWGMPGWDKFSNFKAFASSLLFRKSYDLDTRLRGGVRPIVNIGAWEAVFALDIHLSYLVRAILAEDLEEAIQLGLLEVTEEDVALCTFACPSKMELGPIIRKGLDLYEKEMK